MERHHETELQQVLDKLYLEGSVSVVWDRVYLWFNADRLSKGAYREILRRWEELCTVTYRHAEAPELFILKSKGGLLKIVRKPFKKDEELIPLKDWT